RHWSFRCAVTSFVLSAFLIFVAVLGFSLGFWSLWPDREDTPPWWQYVVPRDTSLTDTYLAGWIVGACVIDYLSLWKTRLILTKMSALRSTVASVGFIAADFMITTALFCFVPFIMMFILISSMMGFSVAVWILWTNFRNIVDTQYEMAIFSFHSIFYF